ncbi:MAG: 30S ribosome-binding factor RbfA [Candidatus Marinimicrobia bacterium]|nr:30S ribosome-binding factor RbfA [Candidatus Neomarinimicrobiota bacterium]
MFSKKPYKRSERMSDEIRSILGGIFISDFQIQDAGLLTVSKVEVTSDLRLAKVFISLLSAKKTPDEVITHLKHNRKAIRFHLGNKLNAKFVPDLRFYYDDSLKKAEKIGTLLTKIRKNENLDNS